MIRWLRRIALAVAAVYLLALGALYAAQDALVFPGWAGPSPDTVAAVPDMAEIVVPGPDGTTLRGWYRPADPGHLTMIVFHGNAGFQWGKLPPLAARGYGLLLVTYRGFAGVPGAPSEANLLADGRAALAHAAALGVAPEDTVLYGESLGTGVAARMALEPGRWRALVLDAPYTSIPDRATEMYPIFPVRALIRTQFDTLSIIDRVDTPLLIFHGTDDFVIPDTHGRALLAAAAAPKHGIWIEGGTHFLPPGPIVEGIEAFLTREGAQSP
ncbi:MAG: alpha/beta hydrolase [Pseudomonadota bacterium]